MMMMRMSGGAVSDWTAAAQDIDWVEIGVFFIREEVPLPSYLVLDESTMKQTGWPRPSWSGGRSGSSWRISS